jgi:hypothetical protein
MPRVPDVPAKPEEPSVDPKFVAMAAAQIIQQTQDKAKPK